VRGVALCVLRRLTFEDNLVDAAAAPPRRKQLQRPPRTPTRLPLCHSLRRGFVRPLLARWFNSEDFLPVDTGPARARARKGA
jgi:hypothetical protein